MKQRDCDHWPKTKEMWAPALPGGTRAFDPVGKTPYFATCEKCGVAVKPAWIAEREVVCVAQHEVDERAGCPDIKQRRGVQGN